MSDPVVSAAVPELVAVLQAIKQFNANIGADPQQWALKVGPAFTVLLGTVGLQVPALVAAEGGAVQADVNNTLDGWIAKLQAKA